MKTHEFVISVGNLRILAMNDEILRNVINISHDSPVNGEASNTFGTLELLFPIFKKFILVSFQKESSCYIPKRIILLHSKKNYLVTFQKESSCYIPKRIILWHSKKHHSCFVVKRINLVTFQKASICFDSKKDRSFLVSLWLYYRICLHITNYIANGSIIN